jgi:hypothetical protein
MAAFNQAIEQMLWPERREKDTVLGDKIPGTIDRTTERSFVYIPISYLPDALQRPVTWTSWLLPWLSPSEESIAIGPIPAGTPVNLLANTKLRAEAGDSVVEHAANLARLAGRLVLNSVASAESDTTSDDQLRERLSELREPFMALSKCPDFVVNRGHYFGTAMFNQQDGLSEDERAFGTEPELNDNDKRALIEFLKTF